MQALRTMLNWIAIAAAFFVVVGLLTMSADKPPDDMRPAEGSAPAK